MWYLAREDVHGLRYMVCDTALTKRFCSIPVKKEYQKPRFARAHDTSSWAHREIDLLSPERLTVQWERQLGEHVMAFKDP